MDPEEKIEFHPAIQSLLNKGIVIPPHLKNLFLTEKIAFSKLNNNARTPSTLIQLDITPASLPAVSPAAILPRQNLY